MRRYFNGDPNGSVKRDLQPRLGEFITVFGEW